MCYNGYKVGSAFNQASITEEIQKIILADGTRTIAAQARVKACAILRQSGLIKVRAVDDTRGNDLGHNE
jgi:hypothetical protein